MTGRTYGDMVLYRRLLAEVRPYWAHIAGLLFISLMATPLALLTPLPLKIAVDSVLGGDPVPGFLTPVVPEWLTNGDAQVLALVVLLTIVVAVLTGIQELASWLLMVFTGERMVLGFRRRLFNHVQRLSLAYHDQKGTFDASYRIQYDAPSIQHIAIEGVIPLFSSAVTLLAMFAVVLLLDWQLALVAIAVAPMLYVALRLYQTRLRQRAHEVRQLESSAMGVVQEVLGSLRVVKAFGQEEREGERFSSRANESVRARVRLTAIESSLGLLITVITAAGTATVLFVGVRHVQSGSLTLGELLLVMGYLSQLYVPLRTMSRTLAGVQGMLAGAERAFAVLDEPTDVAESPDPIPLARAKGHVTFRRVGFRYGSTAVEDPYDTEFGSDTAWTFRNVDVDIPAGSRVGITGATGAGKTTLVSLLSRFYDPIEGQLLLDGVDLRDYRLADLRNQFSIVLQEPVLFSTSILENIAYARPSASMDEIVAAAQAANVHDFIAALPDGYRTGVGERGMRLSGGERQRISLARAFLKDAPILVLDEPTSSVDIATEASIMEAMDRLMAGRTAFMIAHRLSTLDGCDLRLQLSEGGRVSVLSTPLGRPGQELGREDWEDQFPAAAISTGRGG